MQLCAHLYIPVAHTGCTNTVPTWDTETCSYTNTHASTAHETLRLAFYPCQKFSCRISCRKKALVRNFCHAEGCRGFGTGCPPLHLAGCRLQGSWVPWMLLRAASASRCEQGRNRGIPGQEDDEKPQGIRLIPAPPSCFSYCWCQAASGLGGVGMGLRASSRSDRSMYA